MMLNDAEWVVLSHFNLFVQKSKGRELNESENCFFEISDKPITRRISGGDSCQWQFLHNMFLLSETRQSVNIREAFLLCRVETYTSTGCLLLCRCLGWPVHSGQTGGGVQTQPCSDWSAVTQYRLVIGWHWPQHSLDTGLESCAVQSPPSWRHLQWSNNIKCLHSEREKHREEQSREDILSFLSFLS